MSILKGPEELAKENGLEADNFRLVHNQKTCDIYIITVRVTKPPTVKSPSGEERPIPVEKYTCKGHGVESGLFYLEGGERVTFRG